MAEFQLLTLQLLQIVHWDLKEWKITVGNLDKQTRGKVKNSLIIQNNFQGPYDTKTYGKSYSRAEADRTKKKHYQRSRRSQKPATNEQIDK